MLRKQLSFVLTALCLVISAYAQFTPVPFSEADKRAEALLHAMTSEEKITLLGGTEGLYTRPLPRLNIPALRMSDGPVGVHDYGLTTAYPAGIALAASWDTNLAHRVGVSMGKDARARGVHFILGPGLNIYRAPMGGRNFEYLGEDPFLASRIVVPLVEGIQEQGVIATVKHFALNNEEFDRQKMSSDIDERTLREIYLPAFEAAVREAKVGAIMDSYNLINGVHATANSHLNNDIVKREWGFTGIIMSDWAATHDGVAAANGGLDLEMPSAVYMTPQSLIPALKNGKVSQATIDDKVRRILRTAIEFGFFDRDQMDTGIPLYRQEGRAVALEEARASMVLLKNANHLLPLNRNRIKSIAVLGPNAYPAVVGGGGSSQVTPYRATSFLEGISDYLGPNVKVLNAVDELQIDEIARRSQLLTRPSGPSGLKAEYFDNLDLHGSPAVEKTDDRIDFDWGEGSYSETGADHFSVRWTGYFTPSATTVYNFFLSANDGGRVYLNDKLVLDDTGTHAKDLATYSTELKQGTDYKIRVEYFKNVRTAAIRFGIAPVEQPPLADSGGRGLGIKAREAAAKADVVVLCVGFNPWLEGEGSDRTFQLPEGQEALIRQIAAINKNVIVVLTAGGNVDMTGWIDKVPALLHVWYPGQEGGTALAQLLFGEYSPSGKLPVSFERRWEDSAVYHSYYPKPGEEKVEYSEGVFLGYRHFDRAPVKPMFPFGYGLSYTSFAYNNLVISPATGDLSKPVSVSFDIKNIGAAPGAEVAEVYVGEAHASVPRPVKELKGFARVHLQPGETKRVTLTLNRRAFSFYDVKQRDWSAEPGSFAILAGASSEDIRLRGSFVLKSKVTNVRHGLTERGP